VDRRELPPEVQRQIEELASVASHPQFVALVNEIEEAPEEQRAEVASRLASLPELESRGIPIPQGMRLTTRWFEKLELDRGTGERLLADSTVDRRLGPPGEDQLTVCGSVGYIVCGSVGGDIHLE
jgi:hypothetical protein